MAELPKNIRKPGGALVAARSPFTRRVLLPTEADLCNALGLTEEEYFQFLEGVAAKVKERPEAYGLIPDIRCDPVSLGLATQVAGSGLTLTMFGQIAVGVALSVISYLLTPKPKSMKQGTAERTADMAGLKRFAPQFSFNSVQDLANLGDLVPLVFSYRREVTINGTKNTYGGIRVNSQLLWSQLVSLGRYQQLKILALFSLGEIAKRPDIEGYAIGDLLLENYHAEKLYKLNYTADEYGPAGPNIPFLPVGGTIPNDIFRIDDLKHFSGTRNPTTQAMFGLSNPVPNATAYYLPYELIRTASDISDDEQRPAGRITLKKRRKLLGAWPMRAGFVNSGTTDQQKGDADATVGDVLTYQIVGSGRLGLYEGIGYQQDSSDEDLTMDPHGVEDVNAGTKTVREATDSYLAVGEQYMAGSALVSCFNIVEGSKVITGEPWDGTKIRSFSFKVVETGRYESIDDPNGGLGTHCGNPYWNKNGAFFAVREGDQRKFYYEQNYQDIFNANSRYTLQKATLGTISNNRKCHITEIGIKSKVFKEMQFANVNSKPSEEKIFEVYDNNSTLTLGNVNKYITRYSFFKLQVRKSGEEDWKWLKPTTNMEAHTGLFCVRGNTPEFQYNYIRIDHPSFDQYEYRFFPHPGAAVVKEVEEYEAANRYTPVYAMMLNANGVREETDIQQFECDNYFVKFAGERQHILNKKNLSNKEWNLGEPSKTKIESGAKRITGFFPDQAGNYPGADISNLPEVRTSNRIFTNRFFYPPNYDGYVSGHGTTIAATPNDPSPGLTKWRLYINRADLSDMQNQDALHDGEGTWTGLVANNYQGSDPSRVEFHYTTTAGNGGKFTPHSYKINHPGTSVELYSVNKDEQEDISAVTPAFEGPVMVDGGVDGAGMEVNLTIYTAGSGSDMEYFAMWSLHDPGNNAYKNDEVVEIRKGNDTIDHLGLPQNIEFQVKVSKIGDIYSDEILSELNPYDAAADFWQYEGDRSSHLDGPEHQITYCNEIVRTANDPTTNHIPEGTPATYENLAYAGLRIDSSKEWTNFSQFSAYFKEGIKVKRLISDSGNDAVNDSDGVDIKGKGATNIFPEIAYALLTDKTIGAGAVVNASSVDENNMRIAAKFCRANGLFWDGILSNKVNLREFIYEQAVYSLLDFTIIGGKFSLFPTVPYKSDFTIDYDGKPTIKAMFTDGNIKDLNVSFLSSEDRQTFKANVLYRLEQENGFPEIKSAVVRLAGSDHVDDPLETFDLSGFCTNRQTALLFAKYTLALRKHLDHTVSFKTAPHFINGVKPGDYIRVFSTTQHVDRFNNGAILDDGSVVCKDLSELTSGSQPKAFYYWNPSTVVNNETMSVTEASVDFTNASAVKAFAGSLFTLKETEAANQCYKVESITFGEDGLVELTGSYAKLSTDAGNEGKLEMLQNWSSVSSPVFDYEEA